MGYILSDSVYHTLAENCVPEMALFLKGLNEGTASGVDFAGLKAAGLELSDGSIWRVVGGNRSGGDQLDFYKKGRKVSYDSFYVIGKGSSYLLTDSKVVDPSKVVTNAWVGKSYHNYGAAVDLIFRRIGYDIQTDFVYNGIIYSKGDLRKLYVNCGLLHFASSCGLAWGGNWADFSDYAHFEAVSYKLPPESENYNSNLNYRYLLDYNKVGSSGGMVEKKKTDSKLLLVFVLPVFLIFLFLKDKLK